jgi:N-acetylglucosamine kinase-like BadF-type ATPase
MPLVLGVDAGGSKCEALVVDLDGRVRGWGRVTPEDPAAGRSWSGSGRSRESVLAAVGRALAGLDPDLLYVSGLGRWDVPELLAKVNPGRVEVVPVAEWQAPLALVGETCGVVALAGTGAFVFGRRRDGRQLHLDGAGPLLGDWGSGYQIGAAALRAVVRATWHERHATVLVETVRQVLGFDVVAQGVGGLVGWVHDPRDRAEIAILARWVDEAARAGDAVAADIIAGAAGAQAEIVADLVSRLDIAAEPYALVAAGSVATRSALYWRTLSERVAAFAPNLAPIVPAAPQVVGMVLGARQRLAATGRLTGVLPSAAGLAAQLARWDDTKPQPAADATG